MRETHHAPGRLELVRAFVNTLDIEEETDELGDVEAALEWLREHHLVGEETELSDAGRRRLIEVREALRELLLANNRGERPPQEALEVLNQRAERIELGLRFEPEGARLVSSSEGPGAALAILLATVHAAMREGSWERLKVCPAEDCRWAFYDRSRNRSAVWCRMGECGNRSKARRFRARQAAGGGRASG